jgi:hypothetical protein
VLPDSRARLRGPATVFEHLHARTRDHAGVRLTLIARAGVSDGDAAAGSP